MNPFYVPLERPGQMFGGAPGAGPSLPDRSASRGLFAMRAGSDGISVCPGPPQLPGGSASNFMLGNLPEYGPIAGLIQQFMSFLAQFANMFSVGTPQGENFFTDASASSAGDPHLAFNGTQAGGQTQTARFDSMASHQDLIDSDSVPGGYRVSTSVTAPNASGVTTNQSATVTTNFGATRVSLDRSGVPSIVQDGNAIPIAPGQTLDLGNGQTVTKNGDGSLTVINVTGQGGTLNTTMKVNGSGVDVATSAHDADLGGDILQPNVVDPGQPRFLA